MKIIKIIGLIFVSLVFGLSQSFAESFEEAAEETNPRPQVYWDDGLRISVGEDILSLKINTLIQPRYSFTDTENSDVSSFSTQRARIILSGAVLEDRFSFYLNTDFVDEDGDLGGAELLDAFISWHVHKDLDFRIGRYKVPVSRQFSTSSRALQFVDRSLVSDLSSPGRKDGVGTMFDLAGGQVQAGLGLFNGLGSNVDAMDTRHTGAASLRLNPLGVLNPFEEGDLYSTDELAVSYGAAYAYGEESASELERHSLSIDANIKYSGFSLHGEFFWNRFSSAVMESAEPLGFYIQSGYFVIPQKLELAARYSFLDCDDGKAGLACAGNKDINQASASLNYHWQDYNMKGQLGYDYIRPRGPEVSDFSGNTNRLILQLTSYF